MIRSSRLSPISTCLLCVLFLFSSSQVASGYSVLTHEEIVDLLWLDQIRPLLLAKFPGTTTEQLKEAHAYAYGGCLIQDMGYYPFGNRHFSDLVHYVRSGDFVVNLIDEAKDVNELAFALGALSHYAADLSGHPAVNTAVGMEFPKLRAKYGDQVTFAEDPKAHIRTEFGFDVAQVARQRYTSDSYHDFIGFEVAKPLLERAFLKTYGIELKDVFMSVDLSIGSFRRSVSHIIPEMTRVALVTRNAQLVRENPNFTKKKFLYNLSRAEYERNWGKGYQRPGFGARFLAVIFHLIPKVGPFKAINFKTPSTRTENLYLKSVNTTVDQYRIYLQQLAAHHNPDDVRLPNRDFDTGKKTKAGEYELTDRAYAKLLDKLADAKFANVTPALRQDILVFYSESASTRNSPSTKPEDWQKTLKNLESLKSAEVMSQQSTSIPATR